MALVVWVLEVCPQGPPTPLFPRLLPSGSSTPGPFLLFFQRKVRNTDLCAKSAKCRHFKNQLFKPNRSRLWPSSALRVVSWVRGSASAQRDGGGDNGCCLLSVSFAAGPVPRALCY